MKLGHINTNAKLLEDLSCKSGSCGYKATVAIFSGHWQIKLTEIMYGI